MGFLIMKLTSQFGKFKSLVLSLLILSFTAPVLAGNILWVGAHPNDELYISPLLGKMCHMAGNKCSFLTLTAGEKGKCLLPQGCDQEFGESNLGFIRSQEMERSALFFNAELTQWDLGDAVSTHTEGILAAWGQKAGSVADLMNDVQIEIMMRKPDAIIIFDPRHGTSCHPDHKASGTLLLHAARAAEFPFEKIFMLESVPTTGASETGEWKGFRKVADDDKLLSFDGSVYWPSLIEVIRIHASQFAASFVDAVSVSPTDSRKIHLLRVSDTQENDNRYWICQGNQQ